MLKFSVWVGTTVLYETFFLQIFEIRAPLTPCSLNPPKVKFFISCVILLKFETEHFHMLTNNNLRSKFMNRSHRTPRGTLPPSLKKIKFFIYGAILLKFETQRFHMYANNNCD